MFTLQEAPIDIAQAKNAYADPKNGAMVTFEGIVRGDKNNDKTVNALMYIADAPVCIAEGEKIMKECLSLFPVAHAVCIQRIGKVNVGETAVWIGVCAGHRDEAFKACRYIIEEVKKRLIIWKKEYYADGSCAWIHGCQTTVTL